MVMVVVIGLASHGGMDHRGWSCRQSHSCMLDRCSRRVFVEMEREMRLERCGREGSGIPSSVFISWDRGGGGGGEQEGRGRERVRVSSSSSRLIMMIIIPEG